MNSSPILQNVTKHLLQLGFSPRPPLQQRNAIAFEIVNSTSSELSVACTDDNAFRMTLLTAVDIRYCREIDLYLSSLAPLFPVIKLACSQHEVVYQINMQTEVGQIPAVLNESIATTRTILGTTLPSLLSLSERKSSLEEAVTATLAKLGLSGEN